MDSLKGLQADVLVIGGGPAGLATAIAARLKGFDVVVVDSAQPAIDKACGEGILPAGMQALSRLGVHIDGSSSFPFRGIRFIGSGVSIEAAFPKSFGVAIRRTHLHDALVRRAEALGVRCVWGTPVRSIGSFPNCRWVVGADGERSCVRREGRLDEPGSFATRFGFRRHYRVATWTDVVEVYWGARCQAYVTPLGPDEIGVALLTRDSHLRLDRALCEFPELQRRLKGACPTSVERGATTTSRRLRRIFSGRTVLVGDASGSVDAITGAGLTLSFLQACSLGEALAVDDLHAYEAEHRRFGRRASVSARVLLLLERCPQLRRTIFQTLAWKPSIFTRLLAALTIAGPSEFIMAEVAVATDTRRSLLLQ